jgi:hypothetical protein
LIAPAKECLAGAGLSPHHGSERLLRDQFDDGQRDNGDHQCGNRGAEDGHPGVAPSPSLGTPAHRTGHAVRSAETGKTIESSRAGPLSRRRRVPPVLIGAKKRALTCCLANTGMGTSNRRAVDGGSECGDDADEDRPHDGSGHIEERCDDGGRDRSKRTGDDLDRAYRQPLFAARWRGKRPSGIRGWLAHGLPDRQSESLRVPVTSSAPGAARAPDVARDRRSPH